MALSFRHILILLVLCSATPVHAQISFIDATSQAGVDGVADLGGGNRSSSFSTNMAWGDYDNDGDLDLYITNWASAQSEAINILYRQEADHTFTDVRSAAGVASEFNSVCAVWGDCDNDGDLDLYVVNFYEVDQLYLNNGNGTFTEAAAQRGLTGYDDGNNQVAAWVDYDRDGDLDLYVGKLNAPNLFFVNDGTGYFVEAGSTLGIADIRDAEGVVWVDYDTSGTPDLYVVNREQDNKMYRNTGGAFTEVSAEFRINNTGIGRNAAWGDMNGDGLFDCYLSNIGANILYQNHGTFFQDHAAEFGVQFDQGGFGFEHWDAAWGDVDNDGDEDLFTAGGAEAGDEPNALFRNNNGTGFTDITGSAGALTRGPLNTAACSFADYDRDGDLDLYIANSPRYNNQGVPVNLGENTLYQNTLNAGNGLIVRVKGQGNGFSNKNGIGARVKVFPQGGGAAIVHREIRSGAGPLEAHFGLTAGVSYNVQVIFPGAASTPRTVTVTVPAVITVEEQ